MIPLIEDLDHAVRTLEVILHLVVMIAVPVLVGSFVVAWAIWVISKENRLHQAEPHRRKTA